MCTPDLIDYIAELDELENDLKQSRISPKHPIYNHYPDSADTDVSKFVEHAIMNEKGETVIVPIRVPVDGQYVVIDGLHYVLTIDDFAPPEAKKLSTTLTELFALDLDIEQYTFLQERLLDGIKYDLGWIFGEHFTNIVQTVSGINFYKHGYKVVSEQGETLLNIGFGGKNSGVFFGLTGTGCKMANDGWETRLHDDLLVNKTNARITRVDLAHDDLIGAYSSFETANQKESDDYFMLPKSRIRPACTILGEFKHGDPQGKGLTLGIGSRANGKYFRGYEKGKQLGDSTSPWFRSELEIRAVKRIIPLDVLIEPTEYFAGAYPYCLDLLKLAKDHQDDDDKGSPIQNVSPIKISYFKSVKNEAKIAVSRAMEIFKNQFGKYLKVFGEIFQKDGKPDYQGIYNSLITDKTKDYHPKRLALATYVYCSPRFGTVQVYL